ncbi:MAG: ABC-F family ATP-binding cassette domain-containing protein, partial [Helicobacter sp.]|nr:ABC-F family ATP-binding cassette domain-containing protein [Helicobacter sp.]
KVGIIGENGAGKTTFIKLLLGELEPDNGHFDVGSTIKWGHYSQDGIINYPQDKKVIDAVRDIAEEIKIDEKTRLSASQFLTRFLFSPEDQQKYISKLSGGEKRRLYLATVLMKNPNFLILDEPTNDLDIITLSILEDYLINFKGCAIVVSHDRFFLDRIADHLFVFEGNGIVKDFPGNYSEYRETIKNKKLNNLNASNEKVRKGPASQEKKINKSNKNKLSYKEKKELEEINLLIPQLEEEKALLEENMSSGSLTHTQIM